MLVFVQRYMKFFHFKRIALSVHHVYLLPQGYVMLSPFYTGCTDLGSAHAGSRVTTYCCIPQ